MFTRTYLTNIQPLCMDFTSSFLSQPAAAGMYIDGCLSYYDFYISLTLHITPVARKHCAIPCNAKGPQLICELAGSHECLAFQALVVDLKHSQCTLYTITKFNNDFSSGIQLGNSPAAAVIGTLNIICCMNIP